eukprot:4100945-Pleurochrysis_carterae.AAC.1
MRGCFAYELALSTRALFTSRNPRFARFSPLTPKSRPVPPPPGPLTIRRPLPFRALVLRPLVSRCFAQVESALRRADRYGGARAGAQLVKLLTGDELEAQTCADALTLLNALLAVSTERQARASSSSCARVGACGSGRASVVVHGCVWARARVGVSVGAQVRRPTR